MRLLHRHTDTSTTHFYRHTHTYTEHCMWLPHSSLATAHCVREEIVQTDADEKWSADVTVREVPVG